MTKPDVDELREAAERAAREVIGDLLAASSTRLTDVGAAMYLRGRADATAARDARFRGELDAARFDLEQEREGLCAYQSDLARAISLAGDFLGTAPEYRNAACIEIAIGHAEDLRRELSLAWAEVARLRANAEECARIAFQREVTQQGRAERAEAEVARLRAALQAHGTHLMGCAELGISKDRDVFPKCDCGLRTALAKEACDE